MANARRPRRDSPTPSRPGRPASWASWSIPLAVAIAITATVPGLSRTVDPARVPVVSAASLEDEYGLRLNLVAVTAAGGLVDVRFTVTDKDKALHVLHDAASMPELYVEASGAVLRAPKPLAHKMVLLNGATLLRAVPELGRRDPAGHVRVCRHRQCPFPADRGRELNVGTKLRRLAILGLAACLTGPATPVATAAPRQDPTSPIVEAAMRPAGRPRREMMTAIVTMKEQTDLRSIPGANRAARQAGVDPGAAGKGSGPSRPAADVAPGQEVAGAAVRHTPVLGLQRALGDGDGRPSWPRSQPVPTSRA